MPPSRSKSNRITCLVEENLPNCILVSYKNGSKVFRGVLIDERCSKVKRIIPSSLYPARKKLKTQRQLFKSKQLQQTSKPRCQSLRSHIPEPNCIILDDVDFIETGKSPIDSIKGLVERIDKDINIPPRNVGTTANISEATKRLPIINKKMNSTVNEPIEEKKKKKNRKANARQRIDKSNNKHDSTKSIKLPLSTTDVSMKKKGFVATLLPNVEINTSVVGSPLLPIRSLDTSDETLLITKDIESSNNIDVNDNKFAQEHSLAILKELESRRTPSKKPSLFAKSPTESLRDMLNAKRIACTPKELAHDKSIDLSKVHNTRFKGSNTVNRNHEAITSDDKNEISPKSNDDNFLICPENIEEDVSLIDSPIEKKDLACFCPTEYTNMTDYRKADIKGSRKRKAVSLSSDEKLPTKQHSCGESNPSMDDNKEGLTDNKPTSALLRNNITQTASSQSTGKKNKRKSQGSSMRDKELINFTALKSKSSCLFYAKDDSISGDNSSVKTKIPLFAMGDVVWGKIHGHPWWPGKVVSICTNETISNDRERQYNITWFGCDSQATNTMKAINLVPFSSEFKKRLKTRKYGSYRIAVKEAVLACKLKD